LAISLLENREGGQQRGRVGGAEGGVKTAAHIAEGRPNRIEKHRNWFRPPALGETAARDKVKMASGGDEEGAKKESSRLGVMVDVIWEFSRDFKRVWKS